MGNKDLEVLEKINGFFTSAEMKLADSGAMTDMKFSNMEDCEHGSKNLLVHPAKTARCISMNSKSPRDCLSLNTFGIQS